MKKRFSTAILFALFISAGCASYSPSLVRLDSTGPDVRKASQGDLTVYVDEYATEEKCKKAFDTVMPNKEKSGFLFFQLDEGRENLTGLGLEVTARNTANGEVVKISASLPSVRLKKGEE
ncbi:MAG: hypothetical protein M1508_09745 [Nitrospirae bacterium]|nr:hypothetical protein [Nitrospirota bacterium]MCL5422203.1 hypothetical protein [Nitrospirota bacterium]